METKDLEATLEEVRVLLESKRRDLRARLNRELLLNVLQVHRSDLDILDLKVLNRAVAEFRYAASVFKPYRGIRKVSIFGSARTPEEDPYYRFAVQLGRSLADHGYMVITGAASGIMRAGIEGAGPPNSFGVNILLPFEAGVGPDFQGDPKLITFRYFFTRKIFFVMEAHACALFPGGFGTHDELFEVLTLLQTGRTPPMPVVLMELPGETYWEAWMAFVRDHLLENGYISREDMSFFRIARTAEEGREVIAHYYSTYHSSRRVGDRLVLRLEKELTDADVERLNDSFGDLLQAGPLVKTGPLPEEADEPALRDKPRLALPANPGGAGRLNELILAINDLGSGA